MRVRGYALRTEKTYIHWIRRYIYFIDRRHPPDAGAVEVRDFLTYLAVDRKASSNLKKGGRFLTLKRFGGGEHQAEVGAFAVVYFGVVKGFQRVVGHGGNIERHR